MKYILLFCLFLACLATQAQDINKRLIFIGDAGEINDKQQALIPHAANLVLPGKTLTYFLGDNIYPHGMELVDSLKGATEAILQSQFEPFSKQGVPVYFLAGNHDWDKSGPAGLAKIKAQASYIESQPYTALHFIPEAGTLGPFVQELSDSVVAISYDSEYWVFPHHADTAAVSEAKSKFTHALDSLAKVYHNKQLIVLSHHPMISYGEHSLYFSLSDHLFPLRIFWKKLYLPLPVVGSAYPLIRSTALRSAEDRKDPIYHSLIDSVTQALGKHPRVLYISGHDHGLQFIQHQGLTQIVSGSGSKTSAIRKGPGIRYRYGQQGFTVADFMRDGSLHIRFYKVEGGQVKQAFEQTLYTNKSTNHYAN